MKLIPIVAALALNLPLISHSVSAQPSSSAKPVNSIAIEPTDQQYKNPVVVLVNEHSVSQAEYTAMALRATGRATLIGRSTDGSDGDMSIIRLPGNITTGLSGMGVFYPDGKATQRIGIIPDVIVEKTVAGIKASEDEVLVAALKFIAQKY
ncbi:MAG: S41 family peptidase [Psychrobium sp.]